MSDSSTMETQLAPILPDWPAPPNVHAACSTRGGGVSRGRFAGLNLGRSTGDESAAVTENRRRLAQSLGLPAEPSWIHQVHGIDVVRAPFAPDFTPDADASFTAQSRVVCAVQAADCLPVLLCDEGGTMVAAAHAGWRGLAAGVLENTIARCAVPPSRLMAWLGPAIGPEAFEVGAEVRAAFIDRDVQATVAFRRSHEPGRFFADLFSLARQRLARAGVARVFGGGLSTHADPQRFYSYRRDGVTGRMAAFIWIE